MKAFQMCLFWTGGGGGERIPDPLGYPKPFPKHQWLTGYILNRVLSILRNYLGNDWLVLPQALCYLISIHDHCHCAKEEKVLPRSPREGD